jgi:hypothetical protein
MLHFTPSWHGTWKTYLLFHFTVTLLKKKCKYPFSGSLALLPLSVHVGYFWFCPWLHENETLACWRGSADMIVLPSVLETEFGAQACVESWTAGVQCMWKVNSFENTLCTCNASVKYVSWKNSAESFI